MTLFAHPGHALVVELSSATPFHIARPAEGNRPAQPLRDHLRNVANLAALFAEPLGLVEESKYAGLLHDLGKYRPAFQDYLAGRHGKDADTWHSADGAKIAAHGKAIIQAFAIAGHHSGLHDLADLQERVKDNQTAIMSDLILMFKKDMGQVTSYPGEINRLPHTPENKLVGEFATRMLFSALVDADRLDAAFWPDTPPGEQILDAKALLAYGDCIKCHYTIFSKKIDQTNKVF